MIRAKLARFSRETRDIGLEEAIETVGDNAEANDVPIVYATDHTAQDMFGS